MNALVTGAAGFAGGYLCRELVSHGYNVTGADVRPQSGMAEVNILDPESIKRAVVSSQPDIIFNLAGFASVSASWKFPAKAVELNVTGAVNLLETVRDISKDIRVVLIGSSDEYGRNGSDKPVNESFPLDPVSPYAVSKRCQEDMGIAYSRVYDMDICMTRTFNHIGVGQQTGFVVSDFAFGISEIEKGHRDSLKVGNLSSSRCFSDVRDAVSAYRLIGEKGVKGRVYNVGTEESYKIEDILNMLISLSHCEIKVEGDSGKMRSFDAPGIRCDSTLLRRDTGWEPVYNIRQTLSEILDHFRKSGASQ